MNQFRKDVKTDQVYIVCAKCGSTMIDQNDHFAVRCQECHSLFPWDKKKLTLVRGGSEQDASSGFAEADLLSESTEKEWKTSMMDTVFPFLEIIASTPIYYEDGDEIMSKDHGELLEQWGIVKSKIDVILKDVKVNSQFD